MTEKTLTEELSTIFEGQELTEEFKNKLNTLFEASVTLRTDEIRKNLEEEYTKAAEYQRSLVTESISNAVDSYLTEAVKEWGRENQVGITNYTKAAMFDSLMEDLKTVFEKHHLEVSDDKLDVLHMVEEENEMLKAKLNKYMERTVVESKKNDSKRKNQVIEEMAKNSRMTAYEVEKLKLVAEDMSFVDEDSFREKLETVREHLPKRKELRRTSGVVTEETSKSLDEVLNEMNDEKAAPKADPNDPMTAYVQSLSRLENPFTKKV